MIKTNSTIKLAVTFISLIILTIMFTADDSFARRKDRQNNGPRNTHNERVIVKKHVKQRPERAIVKKHVRQRPDRRDKQYIAPRNTRNERVIVKKNVRHRSEWKAKRRFFNKRWAYDRPYKWWKYDRPYRRGDYYRGARFIRRLPFGYRTVWFGGNPFFVFNGIYYRSAPYGYVVVNSPPETVVVREAPEPVKPFESASGNVLVTISTLNVRTGPGLDYSLVSQVEEGSILEVRGKTDGWLYVQLTDGQSGWVKSVFTERLEPGSG